MVWMNLLRGTSTTPSRKDRKASVARHGAVPQGALDEPGLAVVVLVHAAGVDSEVRLPAHGLVPEGALEYHAGRALEVRLPLVRHEPPPLLFELQDALGLLQRRELLLAADGHFVVKWCFFKEKRVRLH